VPVYSRVSPPTRVQKRYEARSRDVQHAALDEKAGEGGGGAREGDRGALGKRICGVNPERGVAMFMERLFSSAQRLARYGSD